VVCIQEDDMLVGKEGENGLARNWAGEGGQERKGVEFVYKRHMPPLLAPFFALFLFGCRVVVVLGAASPASEDNLFLMSRAIETKHCSTLVAFLAEVSMKGMPILSAKAFAV